MPGIASPLTGLHTERALRLHVLKASLQCRFRDHDLAFCAVQHSGRGRPLRGRPRRLVQGPVVSGLSGLGASPALASAYPPPTARGGGVRGFHAPAEPRSRPLGDPRVEGRRHGRGSSGTLAILGRLASTGPDMACPIPSPPPPIARGGSRRLTPRTGPSARPREPPAGPHSGRARCIIRLIRKLQGHLLPSKVTNKGYDSSAYRAGWGGQAGTGRVRVVQDVQ